MNSSRQAYVGTAKRTFGQAIVHLLENNYGILGSRGVLELIAQDVTQLAEQFFPEQQHLRPGWMVFTGVKATGHKAYPGQSGADHQLVTLHWPVLTDDDLQALSAGESFRNVRRQRHARLLDQALAQGGVLAQTDLAALTLTCEGVVGDDIAHVQQTQGRRLPYRGAVQDVGPTLSHKVEVARLLEAGYLEPEICRMLSPVHNLRSVENYAQSYKNVLKLLERGFAPEEISGILSLSRRLVDQYIQIVKEHHPEIVWQNSSLHKQTSSPHQVLAEGQ